MDAVQIQGIQECNDIFPELLNRVGARRERGLSVTSRVIAQDPELLSKLRNLRVPHGIIRAKSIGEQKCGCSTLTFQRVMNSGISRLNDGHRAYSSPAGILPLLAVWPGDGNPSVWSLGNASAVPTCSTKSIRECSFHARVRCLDHQLA